MRIIFSWSPEGRVLVAYDDVTFKQARARFKREFPQYARYMGAGAGHEDDLAEYVPCICRGKVRQ